MEKYYLVIDIGTGNFRVGLVSPNGTVLSINRKDMVYEEDSGFISATSFNPHLLLTEIKAMIKDLIEENPHIEICGITSTSQRQGIVLIDKAGEAIVGLPNIDRRGTEWELVGTDFDYVYRKTGRWPTRTFSALKLKGIKERQPAIWNRISTFTSISDWIGYELTGEIVYENSQASETLLLDVKENSWSKELADFWGISEDWLPRVGVSGTILGTVKDATAHELLLKRWLPFIIGGADTQLAVEGTNAEVGDVVIVSGTTSPIVKIDSHYYADEKARCCVSRHVHTDQFVVETNGGASGLNYQRIKNVLLPEKSYEEIEDEILQLDKISIIGSFSTLDADNELRLTSGGFLLETPFPFDLKKEDFIYGVLFDAACAITYNFRLLEEITGYSEPYVLGCGGGFQSKVLPQLLSNLLNKEIIIKEGYKDASLLGAVKLCNGALGEENEVHEAIKNYLPSPDPQLEELFMKWEKFRKSIN